MFVNVRTMVLRGYYLHMFSFEMFFPTQFLFPLSILLMYFLVVLLVYILRNGGNCISTKSKANSRGVLAALRI